MKLSASLLCAMLTLMFAAPEGRACSCEPPPPKKFFKQASAVFVGEVIEIKESNMPLGKGFPPSSHAVKFKVSRYWKGVGGGEVTVHSDLGGLPCHQFAYKKGGTYLVYAFGKELISITGCTQGGPVAAEYVVEQLRLFGEGKTPKESKTESRNRN
jgi:hypothetical protein